MNFTARVASRASQPSRTTSILRSVRTVTLGLTSVALTALFVFPVSLPAAADPPLTAAEARAVIEQLETDAAAIDQQYAGVKEEIKQGRAQLKLKQADVKAQTDKVARMKLQVGQVALAQFQNRSLDTAAQLFVTPDTDRFLSQISTVHKGQRESEFGTPGLPTGASEPCRARAFDRGRSGSPRREREAAQIADRSLGQEDRTGEEGAGKLTASQRQQISDAEKNETARANAAGRAATSRSSTRGSVDRFWSWRQSLGLCEGAARRPIRSQWRWTELVGLLRLDNACLGIGRG